MQHQAPGRAQAEPLADTISQRATHARLQLETRAQAWRQAASCGSALPDSYLRVSAWWDCEGDHIFFTASGTGARYHLLAC